MLAIQRYPVDDEQEILAAGVDTPSQKICTAPADEDPTGAQCMTIPGTHTPPVTQMVDRNETFRMMETTDCMKEHGWTTVLDK